jgi:NDP-hexose-3-ketoreductase
LTTRDREVLKYESDLHGCEAWPTADEMLEATEVDAVYLATPTGLHYEQGMRVLQAQKHLWCEKTLTESRTQTEQLARESRQRDLSLCEGLMYFHHPQFAVISEMIAHESFGGVLSLTSQFGLPHLDHPGFRFSPELGGGALLDVAPYPLSIALRLLGSELTVVSSCCDEPRGCAVDTGGFAVLSTVSGARAFLEWGYERAYKNEIAIWGEDASLFANFVFSKKSDVPVSVCRRDQYGKAERVRIDPADSFALMFAAFSEAIDDSRLRAEMRDEIVLRAHFLDLLRAGGPPAA